MKVSIVGGGGLVGSCAAFALQCGGIVREIALVDVNHELVDGQALDLLHGSSADGRSEDLRRRNRTRAPTRDVIMITAGLRRKPDESRLDLINRNVALFRNILADLASVGTETGRDRVRRFQPGRRADLSGHSRIRPCRPIK